MSQDEKDHASDTNQALGYRPPREDRPQTSSLKFLTRPGCLMVYIALIAFVAAVFTNTTAFIIAGILIAALIVLALMQTRGVIRMPKQTEEEVEREWEQRQATKTNMVELAQRTYAKGLFGKWRIAVIQRRSRNMAPIVHEERIFIFDLAGTGIYTWFKGLGNAPQTLAFEHKMDTGGTLHIRLTSPALCDWTPVNFFFEAQVDNFNELELALCLDSTRSIGPDVVPHWPFQGDFLRIVES